MENMFLMISRKPMYEISEISKMQLIFCNFRLSPPIAKNSIFIFLFLISFIINDAILSPEASPVIINIFFDNYIDVIKKLFLIVISRIFFLSKRIFLFLFKAMPLILAFMQF